MPLARDAHHGLLLVIALVAAEVLIGLGALTRRTKTAAVSLGLAVTVAFWLALLAGSREIGPNTG